MSSHDPKIVSARPELTAALTARTGLDDDILTDLVHSFYARVRADELLGPIFEAKVSDWTAHLERMVDFWSSVALMTGRYHGAPVLAHTPLPISTTHFNRWLAIFREAAQQVCTPAGAAHVIERAERIARSLNMAVAQARSAQDAVPLLR